MNEKDEVYVCVVLVFCFVFIFNEKVKYSLPK